MWWHWRLSTLCYPQLLHNTGTFLSLSGQKCFKICPASAPHLTVPYNTDMRHSLVVYVGTVDFLILLVFFYGTAELIFIRTMAWRGGIFGPCHFNQTWHQYIFTFPIFYYLVVFTEYTYEVLCMLFVLMFYSKVMNYKGETYRNPFMFP